MICVNRDSMSLINLRGLIKETLIISFYKRYIIISLINFLTLDNSWF